MCFCGTSKSYKEKHLLSTKKYPVVFICSAKNNLADTRLQPEYDQLEEFHLGSLE